MRVDVGTGFVGELATNYLTTSWLRIPIFGVNSINESVQWLGVPSLLRTDGFPWTDNILCPSLDWGTDGTATNLNWGSQPGGICGNVSVLWSGCICDILAWVCRSPENMYSSAYRVCDYLLR